MKYLKTFENKEIKGRKYWLVPTDERFKDSLKQINCSDNSIEGIKNWTTKEKYVFICCDYYPNYEDWGWMPYEDEDEDSEKYFKDEGYEFMGNINIPDYELDANKYNL